MKRHDVVVIGAGVMGLASAWALRRAGRDVVVLEQFEVGHARGSSHGATRIFRLLYDDPGWVALAQEALPLWRELEAKAGTTLLSQTGLLDARPDTEQLRAALDERGVPHEAVTSRDAALRYGLTLASDAVLDPQGGTALADRTLAAFAAGVQVLEETPALAIVPDQDGVRIETPTGPVHAGIAVVTAGAWATPLLAAAGIELETTVTRETVTYFHLSGAHELPSLIDWNEAAGRHAYALAAGDDLLKVGIHHSGPVSDPDVAGEPHTEITALASDWVRRRYPAADPTPRDPEACLYTSIDDDRFVIERHGPIVVCSACSGHGFKFAPAIGARVAALA